MKGKQKDGLHTGTILASLEVGSESRILIQVVSEIVLSEESKGSRIGQGNQLSKEVISGDMNFGLIQDQFHHKTRRNRGRDSAEPPSD